MSVCESALTSFMGHEIHGPILKMKMYPRRVYISAMKNFAFIANI